MTSSLPNPIRPVGSATVTLTCTVELSPAVDVPVTVNILWTGPVRFSSDNKAIESTTKSYISTVLVESFHKNNSGCYTCRAFVVSESPFITNGSRSGIKRVIAFEGILDSCACLYH